jgi:hypothetical protein
VTALQGNPRIPSADHRSHIFRAWGVMYRQAYPWRAARQQPADGDLVAEGEGLAFVCYSSDIAGARRCALSFRALLFSFIRTGTWSFLVLFALLFPTRRNRGRHRSHVRRRPGRPPALATAHPNAISSVSNTLSFSRLTPSPTTCCPYLAATWHREHIALLSSQRSAASSLSLLVQGSSTPLL